MKIRSKVLSALLVGALPLAALAQTMPAPVPVAAPAPTTAAKEAEALAEALRLSEAWLEAWRAYRNIPALSAAVVRGQDTVWARGLGTVDRARKVPATPDTIYSICSISKLFTAVAVMQQWEEGKVRLDEPLTTYLPWARLAEDPRDSVPVTLRGVLTHSAGLPRESDHPYWTGPDFPFPKQADIRATIGRQSPLYPASRTFQYSNLGLTLAGEAVEAASGTPYNAYVQSRIIDPLGLKNTRPGIPRALHGKQLAVGWGALTAGGTRPEVALFEPAGITPAAGFSSTVNDLARFASWSFRLLKTEQRELLRASTLREMMRPHYTSPDWKTSWGLGFAVQNRDGQTVVGHGGSCPGYRSSLMMLPEKELGIAVMMNAMDDPGLIARQIAALIAKRAAAPALAPTGLPPVPLADYAGTYDEQPWADRSVILPWAGGLVGVSLDTDTPAEELTYLKPLGGDRFRVVTDKGEEREEIRFERNAAGAVVGYVQHGNRTRRVASR
jgi:CubicO group peptidase (beta-lactamase class C family)